MTRRHILLATALLAACYSPQVNRNWADRAAYGLLDGAFERVAGAKREFVVERAVDTGRGHHLHARARVRARRRPAVRAHAFRRPRPRAPPARDRTGMNGGVDGGRRGGVDSVIEVAARAESVEGLEFTYEPDDLRFFQARFAPIR